MQVDKQTHFENHHYQKLVKLCVSSFTILSCFAFNSAFVANVSISYFLDNFLSFHQNQIH